ncbi:hypothetical protein CFOL_v3_27548 [Cephalotus follicularis]|uniref:Uncharacterized protein n=1 Tax=Cephalotus follicularis TaxID=3775 RepID=A0A1Q3CV31_CEPFO|nr:hypothetical protein CFOL_v3_27548 [Cephalotus follicularis]
MTSAIGWYGPLIDLSKASSHIGSFVQLLVYVQRCTPVHYKLSKGGEVIRTDIQVGDDTRPYFSVSLWQKQMGSMAAVGDVILLQNVKVIKFGGVVEARTVQCSSLIRLIHSYESLVSKDVDELISESRVGIGSKEKLGKVVEWVRQARYTLHSTELNCYQKGQFSRNWKILEEGKALNCFSLSEVSRSTNSCKVNFYASIGEIFLPITWRELNESEKEKMFISRRVLDTVDDRLAEDLICTGCQLCGSPLNMEYRGVNEQRSIPLYCQKSPNRLHAVSLIYRPFMLYIWDELEYLPLLVRNKSAELLFGNIKAENVLLCYRGKIRDHNFCFKDVHKESFCDTRASSHMRAAGEIVSSCSSDKGLRRKGKHTFDRNIDFYLIWLILTRALLQQGKNSPLKFEVTVNTSLDRENGRFEMVSVSIPCVTR